MRTPGHRLYCTWLGDPFGRTDAARGFHALNPAVKRQWETLAWDLLLRPEKVAEQLATLQRVES